MAYDFDLIVLGSGPAGYSASMQASKYGKKVMVVEASMSEFGGAWINTGTVPSKALREAAYTIYKYHNLIYDHKKGSRKPYQKYLMDDLLRFKDQVREKENASAKNYFIKNSIITMRGFGTILDDHTVQVNDHLKQVKKYTAEKILISTGSRPLGPKNFELDHSTIRDSISLLKLDHFPRRLVIIGAGVHAMEYASIFAAMGTLVTVLNQESTYLPFLDDDIKAELVIDFEAIGVSILNNTIVEGVEFNPLRNKTEVRYYGTNDPQLQVLETEQVLYLGGRIPNTEKIGLDSIGVQTDVSGFIHVNEHYQSSCPSVYGAGDVIGYPNLASASFSQGRLAACHMFDIPAGEVSSLIPYSIQTIPEIASVGLSEKEALSQGLKVTTGISEYGENTRAQISSTSRGKLKIVFDTESYVLLGAHVIGEGASEIVHTAQALISKKEKVHYFIRNIMNYPSYSQGFRKATFNGLNKIYENGNEETER